MNESGIEHFANLVEAAADGQHVRLAEIALALAAVLAPDEVDIDHRLAQLDSIARLVLTPDLAGVNELLFDELGFRGNSGQYYSPANSRLDLVLDNRTGIPITLAVLMADVGGSVGLELSLTNSPGHVLVVDRLSGLWYDAFNRGAELNRDGVEALLSPFVGGRRVTPAMLRPAPPLQVVSRMLNNLRAIYSGSDDRSGLLAVERMTCAIPGADVRHHLVLANLTADTGDLAGAAASLEAAAEANPGRSNDLLKRATILRARLN
ncbi:MAG: transglutaminase-like domain-containing protein [Acidimicrobiales bacterium]|nr:transglutaminase family protein [Acidimicrobiales bacterium]